MSDLILAFLLSLFGATLGFVLVVLLAVVHVLGNEQAFGAFFGLVLLVPLGTVANYLRLRVSR